MLNGYSLPVLNALNFFVENPYEEIHLREFSRKLKISPNSAQRFLNLFLKECFVIDERRANLRYFKANTNSIVFRNIKITFLLRKIQNSGMIGCLQNNFSNVILFGSSAKGLDDSKSDLDLVCIGKTKISFEKFEKKLKRIINAKFLNLNEWKKIKENNKAFYQDVISEGINIVGEMPV